MRRSGPGRTIVNGAAHALNATRARGPRRSQRHARGGIGWADAARPGCTVNGPYSWGGSTHHVADNGVYAVIYRDLISGYAWGYWGGRYGNDNAKWQGKPPFAAARLSPAPYATFNRYADVIYRYSNAYGFSFSDTGPKKVVVSLEQAKTLRIVIPPRSRQLAPSRPPGRPAALYPANGLGSMRWHRMSRCPSVRDDAVTGTESGGCT